jgi:hypothetical protein
MPTAEIPSTPQLPPPKKMPDYGLFVGILFGIVSIFFFVLQSNGVEVNWIVSAAIYLFCTIAVVWTLLTHALPGKRKASVLAGVPVAALCVILGSVGTLKQFSKEHPTRTPLGPTNPETSKHFVTLKDLFESDWQNLPGYYNEAEVHSPPPVHKIKLAWRLNGDFISRSKFLAFYFDSDVTPDDVVQICELIAANPREFINAANSKIDITIQSAEDTSPASFRDMVFSGRVFIYYDDPRFSLQQKARIETFFERKGLSVQFRGDDYRWLHKDDQALLRKEPLTPNSFLLPDPKKSPPGIFFKILNLGKPVPKPPSG